MSYVFISGTSAKRLPFIFNLIQTAYCIMRKILLTFILLSVLFAACNFSAGVRHEGKTGLTVKNSGLRYESYLLTCNGEPAENSEWARGETVKLQFLDVNGFKEEKGLVYPGISLVVKDMQGKIIDSIGDLLLKQSENGIAKADATKLSASYALSASLAIGPEYELYTRFYDKKGKGVIDAKMKFKLVQHQFDDIKVNASGLSYSNVYLMGRNGRKRNEASTPGKIGLLVEGLKGFKEERGRVFAGGNITIYNKDGKEEFQTKDIFLEYPDGLDPADVTQLLSLYLPVEEEMKGNENKWVFKVWDKKSEATWEADIMLKLK